MLQTSLLLMKSLKKKNKKKKQKKNKRNSNFLICSVFFVSKGNLLDVYLTCIIMSACQKKVYTLSVNHDTNL